MNNLIWLELDASAPAHNLRELKKCARPGVLFCAVIKSNAYGHGMREMADLLDEADWFAVNCLEEGAFLRSLGVSKPVLVLGHVELGRLDEAREKGLRLTVYNGETLEAAASLPPAGDPLRLHLKVETGTGRQGIPPPDIPSFLKRAARIEQVELEGLSTHYANIEDTLNHAYSEQQLDAFRRALDTVRGAGFDPPVVHTACTAAGILMQSTHFTMLREGIGVYGLWPSRETYLSARMSGRHIPDLKPVLTWKTRVVQLKSLPPDSFVGYGCTYRTTRKTRVAVLPVGYGDGYDRALGNTAYVLIRGKRAPVIGRVCMNVTMADVTDIPDVRLENEVILLGSDGEERISAETMAGWAGTINYEIVTRISPSLERKIVHSSV